MKRNQLKAQQLIYTHCEMRGECPHVQRSGDKRQTVFTSSRKSPKMRNTAFSFSFLNTIIMKYEQKMSRNTSRKCLNADFRWLRKEATTSNLPQPQQLICREAFQPNKLRWIDSEMWLLTPNLPQTGRDFSRTKTIKMVLHQPSLITHLEAQPKEGERNKFCIIKARAVGKDFMIHWSKR